MGTTSVSNVTSQINRPYQLISVGQYTVRKGELLVRELSSKREYGIDSLLRQIDNRALDAEQRPPLEADRSSARQEIPRI
jgi:hypothetical protein